MVVRRDAVQVNEREGGGATSNSILFFILTQQCWVISHESYLIMEVVNNRNE